MKIFLPLTLVFLLALNPLPAASEAVLVPPLGEARAGRTLKLTIYLNNPSAVPFGFTVPDTLRAEMASASEQRRLLAVPVGLEPGTKLLVAPMSFATVTVAVVLPETLAARFHCGSRNWGRTR
jgi:hypothetical protein